MIVVVAWKNMYLNDNRVRVLVTRSVTLNQFLQLSEIFFVSLLRKGVICPAYLTGEVVRTQLGNELKSTPEIIASVQILEFCCRLMFTTGKTKMKRIFLLSKFTVVEKTYKHKYSQCFFVVQVLAARPFFFQSSFYTNLCKKEMFWLQEIHLARANCRITLNTPYRKKMKCVVDLY